jgi:ethanolamine utilization cobalamin adenosyltransferase
MGLYDIMIRDVFLDQTYLDTYLVSGQNFTPYSTVYVNGKKLDTTFLDRNTLLFTVDEDSLLQPGDTVTVWQSDLSCTSDYSYVPDPIQDADLDFSEKQ